MKGLIIPLIPLLFLSQIARSQESTGNEIIRDYDFSTLWTQDSIELEFENRVMKRGEPFGYIGDNYQRFQIHFISVIRKNDSPSEYFIYGKTRVKENINSFQGVLQIDSISIYDRPLIEGITQGYIKGRYTFYENPHQSGSGVLSGLFKTGFYLDTENAVKYDAFEIYADGYKNNQFEGTWKSYKSNVEKKCVWGDFRIPGKNNPQVQKAYVLEQHEWWKED